jgi:pyruvate formate lyase activating enzyme
MSSDTTINFGGFVPLSTVDWRGRAVSVVFFRGCPVRCWYCHNEAILDGEDIRNVSDIMNEISSASLLASAVLFSGGEATMQAEALITLAAFAKKIGFATGLHTTGVYPNVLETLIKRRLIDHIALDLKTEWKLYTQNLGATCVEEVKQSFSLCKKAHERGDLPEFDIVITLFRGYEGEVKHIVSRIGNASLVLQQGVKHTIPPLTTTELKAIADTLCRPVRIRTREDGEIKYEGFRNSRSSGLR